MDNKFSCTGKPDLQKLTIQQVKKQPAEQAVRM